MQQTSKVSGEHWQISLIVSAEIQEDCELVVVGVEEVKKVVNQGDVSIIGDKGGDKEQITEQEVGNIRERQNKKMVSKVIYKVYPVVRLLCRHKVGATWFLSFSRLSD